MDNLSIYQTVGICCHRDLALCAVAIFVARERCDSFLSINFIHHVCIMAHWYLHCSKYVFSCISFILTAFREYLIGHCEWSEIKLLDCLVLCSNDVLS